MSLNDEIEEFLLDRAALKVGFATLETMAGGPPSADLTYVLPEARSAVSFALPLDREKIRAFLSKRDLMSHEKDNIDVNIKSTLMSRELALMLKEKGHSSRGVLSNLNYRTDIEGWQLTLPPEISHRYIAVRSGVGSFGWSGNVGLSGYGTAILLGSVVTAARLEPTDPIPPEDSFCDRCKLCIASCASGMVDRKMETSVTLGGVKFTFGARKDYMLCEFVCGGFTGLHRSGKWSTWSPGRYLIPEDREELEKQFFRAVENYSKWPERKDTPGGYTNPALEGMKLRLTCGGCQIVCWGNKEETRENYRLRTKSGCAVQKEDGDVVFLPADEAERVFEAMDPVHRKLYC